MSTSPIIAVAIAVMLPFWRPQSMTVAAPFLFLWAVAPAVAYRLSVPMGAWVRRLGDDDRMLLRRTARKTWRYFETFVTAGDSWLPPDNYQEEGGGRVAHRTSPTNIGMSLLSTLAAHDLGYMTTGELIARLDRTLTTLEGLERYAGHFLNWYNTLTLAPLRPRYVSTVDSGNLAAALMALSQGLRELKHRPQTERQRLAGLRDTADLLVWALASAVPGTDRDTVVAINRVSREILAETSRVETEGRLTRLDQLAAELATLGDVEDGHRFDAASDLAFWRRSVLDRVTALKESHEVPASACESLADRAAALADQMQFGFLYDRRKRMFSVGHHLADLDGPAKADGSSTICWHPRPAWRASSRSRRARCRSTIGSTWVDR